MSLYLSVRRSCDRIYLEMYTSILMVSPSEAPMDTSRLEAFYGKPVTGKSFDSHVQSQSVAMTLAPASLARALVRRDPTSTRPLTSMRLHPRSCGQGDGGVQLGRDSPGRGQSRRGFPR